MTMKEYKDIKNFPRLFITKVDYISDKVKLKNGDIFKGIESKTLGESDFSIMDEFRYAHYFENCELMKQE